MSKQKISTNIDTKEATFEAVMQTAVCDQVQFLKHRLDGPKILQF